MFFTSVFYLVNFFCMKLKDRHGRPISNIDISSDLLKSIRLLNASLWTMCRRILHVGLSPIPNCGSVLINCSVLRKVNEPSLLTQWCSPRDQCLGLEAPRGQKHKSWSWSWDPESWSWSSDKSLGLDLGLDKKVLSIFKPFSSLMMTENYDITGCAVAQALC